MTQVSLKKAPFMMIQFYKYLAEQFGEQGKNTFVAGFYLYTFRKGISCAQRVVSKNLDLSLKNYQLYRESIFATPEGKEQQKASPANTRPASTEMIESGYIRKIYSCSTVDAFREYDAPLELEQLWCNFVDKLMIQVYNPLIYYEVTENFLTKDYCEHHCMEAGLKDLSNKPRTEPAPPLSFLTWRAYSSMVEMIESILGHVGTEIVEKVKADTVKEFGEDSWQEIQQFEGMNMDTFYHVQG